MNEKKQILIVDDNKRKIKPLAATLADNYRILEAINGEHVLILIESNPQIDLILLDIQLSGAGDFDLCKKLKKSCLSKDIPLMIISDNKTENAEKKGLSLGAVDYITRPFSQTILELRVKNQLKLKHQRDLLKRLSKTDSLTGMWNRSKFEEFMNNEWLRAIREKTNLSLILIDIDYFKKYNDFYGHTSGDECIKKITQSIKKSLDRSQDLAARFGGEEFVCVLPNTGLDGAIHIAETIRKNILKRKIPHEQSLVNRFVTVSLGVSSTIPSLSSSAHSLIQSTDKMLYKAKREGRNKVASC